MTTSSRGDCRLSLLSRAVLGAQVEDALGHGKIPEPQGLRRLKDAPAAPLPAPLTDAASRVFGRDLSDVQLVTGPSADAFLDSMRAPAACLGHRIMLSSAVCADAPRAAAALAHEITHLAGGPRDTVRAWDADVHAALSLEACIACRTPLEALARVVSLPWGEFLHGVMNASSNMDIRQRIVHHRDTIDYLAKLRRGEGPRHGEGWDYRSASVAVNEVRNVAEQTRHARLAAAELLRDVPLITIWGRSYRVPTLRLVPGALTGLAVEARRIGGISIMEREWVKSLANSLHVAQDRGSHREGTLGFGHSDSREGTVIGGVEWACDKKMHEHSMGRDWLRCSEAAYNVAFNNSIDAIAAFLTEVGRLVGATFPTLPVARRVTTCP